MAASHSNRGAREADVLAAVADVFGVSIDSILSRSRVKRVTVPRHVACYVLRNWTLMSLEEIGAAVRRRDHSVAIYAIQRVTESVGLLKMAAEVDQKLEEAGFTRMPRQTEEVVR